MPLVIGSIEANVTVLAPPPVASRMVVTPEASVELTRTRELADTRFEAERKIEQRDPNRVGRW